MSQIGDDDYQALLRFLHLSPRDGHLRVLWARKGYKAKGAVRSYITLYLSFSGAYKHPFGSILAGDKPHPPIYVRASTAKVLHEVLKAVSIVLVQFFRKSWRKRVERHSACTKHRDCKSPNAE